jgi:hypothetical protein
MINESAPPTVVLWDATLVRHSTYRTSRMGPCALLILLLFVLSPNRRRSAFNPPQGPKGDTGAVGATGSIRA